MGDIGPPVHRRRRVAAAYPTLYILTVPAEAGAFVTATRELRRVTQLGGAGTIVDHWERAGIASGPFGGWQHVEQFRL